MRELHLFAGAGGGILGGMLLGHEPVGAVEIDPYCRKVLEARQADGCLPQFPILEDVRAFDGRPWRGKVDIVCGGFPCQPWSSAGKRLGTDDPRHLWPEMARIIDEVRPAYVFAENVSLAAFEEPWRDLRRLGYRVPPALCLAAADCGAPHLRKRWWLLARHPDRCDESAQPGEQGRPDAAELGDAADADREPSRNKPGRRNGAHRSSATVTRHDGAQGPLADTDSDSKRNGTVDAEAPGSSPHAGDADGSRGPLPTQRQQPAIAESWSGRCAGWWPVVPRLRRIAHGVPSRVDRLRALGNAQVPMVAATAFRTLMAEHFTPPPPPAAPPTAG